MENDNQKTSAIINDDLPFEPRCPHCLKPIEIEKGVSGYYVLCKWCGDEWAASPFTDSENEMEWLEKFHVDKRISIPDEKSQEKDPSPTKVLMEIAHSSETLKKAYEMVSEAYKLVNSDPVARKYIHFSADVSWHQFVWDILMKQYNKDNPLSDSIYHLRAFDYYGIQPGMLVGEGSAEGN